MFSEIILYYLPTKIGREERERSLAYEMRVRFGFNKMRAFMKVYREKQAAKATPLRLYQERQRQALIKRKEAALKARKTRAIHAEAKRLVMEAYQAKRNAIAAPLIA